MSPILVRPVREQFEHDRVIRVLQAKYKRKYEVAMNPGPEQNASVSIGDLVMFPDLVLFSQERRKLQGTVEVETTESVNTLEAMAEWGPFSRLRAAFFLYVPANTIDSVRRLCTDYNIAPAEIWTYHVAIDQVRFTMVHRSPDAPKHAEPRVKADKPAEPSQVETRKPVQEVRKATPQSGAPTAEPRKATPEARPAQPASIKKMAKSAKAPKPSKSAKAAKPANSRPQAPGFRPQATKASKSAKSAKSARTAKTRTAKAAKTAKPIAKAGKPAPKKRR